MFKATILAVAMLAQSPPSRPDLQRECRFTSAQHCTSSGCSVTPPNLKLFVADFVDGGLRDGYYYRCTEQGVCSAIDDWWVGSFSTGYRVWSSRKKSTQTRMAPSGAVVDIASIEDEVVISRGQCVDALPPFNFRRRDR